ncbi:MAG: restriction endonuclease [Desulfohalobiaceae bacterium]
MAERSENMLELLVDAPWWVSVLVAAVVYTLLRVVLPGALPEETLLGVLAGALSSAAWLIAVILLIPAPVSLYYTWKKDRLLAGQADAGSLDRLSRRAFAQLVQELYAKNGYSVNPSADPEDKAEVDMIVEKKGRTILVQFRHHKSGQVSEQAVEVMLQKLDQEEAQEAHIISCPGFSEQVRELAQDSRLKLLDKQGLASMIPDKRQ